jgi:hypothetical protein
MPWLVVVVKVVVKGVNLSNFLPDFAISLFPDKINSLLATFSIRALVLSTSLPNCLGLLFQEQKHTEQAEREFPPRDRN